VETVSVRGGRETRVVRRPYSRHYRIKNLSPERERPVAVIFPRSGLEGAPCRSRLPVGHRARTLATS
jgi:hypothetical protein